MLHRSFKPAKCKTSLKLAASRLKLLKNKKDMQLKQMKRELAQLLESGQDQTARIRVEHVVREEKMMAAFDLLEIYCELIVARLPIIESQKNCPIDLKEAVTSVVFAAPRCADIEELLDVRKYLTAKYGKEFISAATELRPQCGVSRMLVEKLSANAPDGPTKIKILTAIAEEHNIKWDPKSFGEAQLKPQEDLLNGPNTFEKASRIQTEPSIVQPPPSYVQSPPTPEQKHNEPVNFAHNAMPSVNSENFAAEDARGSQAGMPTRRHPGVRPSGTRSERPSYSGDENSFPSDRKHWNVEFKNATAAAQAAAEAAERASMAARAAAELSSREQYSRESRKSNVPSSRDEGPSKNDHDNPEEDKDKLFKDFLKGARYVGKSSFEEESPKAERSAGVSGNNVRKEYSGSDGKFVSSGHGGIQTDSFNYFAEESIRKQNNVRKESGVSGNNVRKESGVSGNNVRKESGGSDGKFVSSGHGGMQTDSFNYFAEESIRKQNSSLSSDMHATGDLYSQKSSEEAVKGETSTGFPGINMKRQSTGSGAENLSSGQGGMESQSFNYFAEDSIREKNGGVSSQLNSSSHGEDYDNSPFTQPKYEFDGSRGHFDRENEHRGVEQSSSYSNTAAVFDEPVSGDDHVDVFDTTHYAVPAFDQYPASPVRESPRHLHSDTWSPRQNMSAAFEKYPSVSNVSQKAHSTSKYDESSIKSAKPNVDQSEGSSSESEDEVDNSRLGQKTEPSSLSQKENILLRTPDNSQRESRGLTGLNGDSVSNRKEDLNYSSDDDEWVHVNKQRTESGEQAHEKFGFDKKSIRQSSAKLAESQVISNDTTSEPFYSQTEERKNRPAQTSRLSSGNEVEASNTTFSPRQSNNMKDDESLQQSSLEGGSKLKFGMLTGGLRHKSYMPPPYTKSPSSNASSVEKAAEDSVTSIESSPASPSVKSSVKSAVSPKVATKSSSSTPMTDSDPDSDESEEIPQRKLSSKTEPYSPQSSKALDSKPRSRAPVTYFDSKDNDAEDNIIPKQTVNSAGRMGTGFSRRTKPTPSSGRSSHSRAKFGSEASEPNSEANASKTPSWSSNHSETPTDLQSQTGISIHRESPPQSTAEKESTESRAEKESNSRPKTESGNSRNSYPSETPSYPSYQTEYSSNLGRNPPEPRAARQSLTKPMPESNISTRKEKPNSSVFDPPSRRQGNVQSSANQETSKPRPESSSGESKESPKSSALEQRSSPLGTVTSAGPESPSGDSSERKASHVHPKLPDYDSFAAHFQSLRSNR